MVGWRILGILVLWLVPLQTGRAQTYDLTETCRAGDCFRLRLELNLSGEIRINKDGKPTPLKLEAAAVHEFPERTLSVGAGGLPEKTARVYEKAQAAFVVEGNKSERTLRSERKLVVAQRLKDQPLAYSPAGPLTREEVELTSEHFDTLSLTGLLPGKPVTAGETWKVSNTVAQALCNFEGLTEQNLMCKLEEVKDQTARVTLTGSATGIELGALVKLTVEATYLFDLNAKHLTRLDWKQKDERDQGPGSPASSVQSSLVLTRTAIDQPPTLSDVALVSVPEGFEPPPIMTQLEYHDAKTRFDMLYGRQWQTVSQTDEHLVLRLIDRGDFVAQATITPWTKAEKGQHLTPDEFRQAMEQTPCWQAQQELQAGEVPSEGGRWVYRISTLGELDGTKVIQNFYLIAGPNGDQVVMVFTMSPKQADRLGTGDLALAANISFPNKPPE
jgi:hypothetical protein